MKTIGIDVSMDEVDLAVCEKGKSSYYGKVKNNKKGFDKIVQLVEKNKVDLVVMEATGVYHFQLADYLYGKKVKVSVVNPLSIKRFCQMKLSRAKTDKKDSTLIALYGYQESPRLYQPRSKEEEELKSLYGLRKDLLQTLNQTKNRIHALRKQTHDQAFCIATLEKIGETLIKEIKKTDIKIKEILENNFKEENDLLQEVPGVGLIGKAGIIGILGSFKYFENHKQVSAYIGINPSYRQSGKSLNCTERISKKGNSALRTVFYMMALNAKKSNKACKIFYERLLEKGKSKKQAIIAVANKLIKMLMSILKNKKRYDENFVSFKPVL